MSCHNNYYAYIEAQWALSNLTSYQNSFEKERAHYRLLENSQKIVAQEKEKQNALSRRLSR